MPLTISLKPRERLVVNGAVIENSDRGAKILIHNQAALLREKDIVTEDEASTPARRLYFAIQSRYLFPASPASASLDAELAVFDLALATSSVAREIRALLDQGSLYRALKAARRLIVAEAEEPGAPPPAVLPAAPAAPFLERETS